EVVDESASLLDEQEEKRAQVDETADGISNLLDIGTPAMVRTRKLNERMPSSEKVTKYNPKKSKKKNKKKTNQDEYLSSFDSEIESTVNLMGGHKKSPTDANAPGKYDKLPDPNEEASVERLDTASTSPTEKKSKKLKGGPQPASDAIADTPAGVHVLDLQKLIVAPESSSYREVVAYWIKKQPKMLEKAFHHYWAVIDVNFSSTYQNQFELAQQSKSKLRKIRSQVANSSPNIRLQLATIAKEYNLKKGGFPLAPLVRHGRVQTYAASIDSNEIMDMAITDVTPVGYLKPNERILPQRLLIRTEEAIPHFLKTDIQTAAKFKAISGPQPAIVIVAKGKIVSFKRTENRYVKGDYNDEMTVKFTSFKAYSDNKDEAGNALVLGELK
ncbi:MAG: hypothetical protein V4736_01620, partial [Bdellovibrionota bacterium]